MLKKQYKISTPPENIKSYCSSTKTVRNRPRLKSEWFREFEGQSYPVLEFEVEIRTLTRVEGYKIDFTFQIIRCFDLLIDNTSCLDIY